MKSLTPNQPPDDTLSLAPWKDIHTRGVDSIMRYQCELEMHT